MNLGTAETLHSDFHRETKTWMQWVAILGIQIPALLCDFEQVCYLV